jgi:site-specific recombinase XerD
MIESQLARPGGFHAERAISPLDHSTSWVVLDASLFAHPEASRFLASLEAMARSPNTIRAYAGRVASFLAWCESSRVEWSTIGLAELARFKHFLEATRFGARHDRVRSGATVNAVLVAICEFLRFCARTGLIAPAVAEALSEPRYLRFVPRGFDPGEHGQFRQIRARALKARAETPFPDALSAEQSKAVLACCRSPRERFVVMLLHESGIRIGEALGLRFEDLHLLPDSRSLGCPVLGAHFHVRQRANPNGALAKSRVPRLVPASEELVGAYAEYRFERAGLLSSDNSDMVIVNLYHEPLGAAMSYQGAKSFFNRLTRECGFSLRPHLLRHTAATNWVRAGVPLDVVQRLLGHASLASTTVYLHASDEDRRRAVEAVASGRSFR